MHLKKFFEKAKQSRYYDNTIFIITGDHGMSQVSPSVEQTLTLSPARISSPAYYPLAKILSTSQSYETNRWAY